MWSFALAVMLAWANLPNNLLALHMPATDPCSDAAVEGTEEQQCSFPPISQSTKWENFVRTNRSNPFGTVFPAQWVPKCPCNAIVANTKQVVKFNAFHKCGTKLSIKGGKCFGAFFNRRNNEWASVVRERCGHGCNSSMQLPKTKEVWWTRAPLDWLISNYQYHKRGDEKLKCYMNTLHHNFDVIRSIRPEQPKPEHGKDNYYCDYLQRISLTDGLFIEMHRTTHSNSIGSLTQLVVAALQGDEENKMKVCLEDFMESSTAYDVQWEKILNFSVGSGVGMDSKLKSCLSEHSYASTSKTTSEKNATGDRHHSTYFSSTVVQIAEMRQIILKFDKDYFNNTFAKATKDVGCEMLP